MEDGFYHSHKKINYNLFRKAKKKNNRNRVGESFRTRDEKGAYRK